MRISDWSSDVCSSDLIHNMASWMIDRFGAQPVKDKYLPDLVTMATLASYCLTEPSSGSDAAALRTKAVRDGDHYVVTGTKQFIRSEEHTSELQSLMRISYAVFCLEKKKQANRAASGTTIRSDYDTWDVQEKNTCGEKEKNNVKT